MQPDWKSYCRTDGLKVEENDIEVSLDTDRRQSIRVEEDREAFHLISLVATKAIIERIVDASIRAWQRNRSVTLVSFRVDHKGRMIGESWVPKAGLTGVEFQLYVNTLAVECDRFEHQLTGRDVE